MYRVHFSYFYLAALKTNKKKRNQNHLTVVTSYVPLYYIIIIIYAQCVKMHDDFENSLVCNIRTQYIGITRFRADDDFRRFVILAGRRCRWLANEKKKKNDRYT